MDHKRWLETLKSEVRERKERTAQEMMEEELKRMKVKETSKRARELIEDGQTDKVPQLYPHFDLSIRSHSAPKQMQHVSANQERGQMRIQDEATQTSPINQSPAPIRKPAYQEPQDKAAFKKKKPAWALTADQHAEDEVDELLNFMDKFDASQYAEDVQVRELMANLEKRVEELKQEDNWKENWEKRLKERRKKKEEEYLKEKASKAVDDDMIPYNGDNTSQIGITGGSMGSRGEARTVMSEKTQGSQRLTEESIRSIKEKMETQSQGKGDWNKSVNEIYRDF